MARKSRSPATRSRSDPGSVTAAKRLPSAYLLPEVVHVRARLERRARLRRDEEQRLPEIEPSLESPDGLRVRRVEDVEALRPEGPPQHLGREARAAHACQDDIGEAVLVHTTGERLELLDALLHAQGLVQPAEPPVLVGPGPERRVAVPDPLDELGSADLHQAATSSRLDCRMPSRSSAKESANFSTPSALQGLDDVVVVDPGLGQVLEQLASPVEIALDGVGDHLAVVLEGLDGLRRHRVDGHRADQLLHVQHVPVRGVLRRRRGPEAPLRRRALAGEELPALAGEKLLVPLVGELGVGDPELALSARRARRSRRGAGRSPCPPSRRRSWRRTRPRSGLRRPPRGARGRGYRPRRPPRSAGARRSASR